MEGRIVVRRPVGPPPLALRLVAVLAVPLLLYALVATGEKAVDNYRLNQEADGLRAEIAGLRQQNIQLQQDIEAARSDTAIETIAREQLGLVRAGDHAVVLVGQAAPATPQGQPSQANPPSAPSQQPAWRQWWEYFFG
jgi:cell division protein FtsL